MKLQLVPRLEQKQILAPQMRLSMEILLLNSLDLENRIEKEFMENPALELLERERVEETKAQEQAEGKQEVQELFEVLDSYERRYGQDDRGSMGFQSSNESDSKHEAIQNHADRPHSLIDHLEQQIRFLDIPGELQNACRQLVGNIDERGYLIGGLDEIWRLQGIEPGLAVEALAVIHSLEPAGVGARDLRECLLLQLGDDDPFCLERRIIDEHLEDLLQNRLPRIAEHLSVRLEEVKEAVELVKLLNPTPGSGFGANEKSAQIPEVFLDEDNGHFRVRVDEGVLPTLRISPACTSMLREGGHNPRVVDFVRRKIEAARWLIHAIDQRRRTLRDIAQAIVDHQEVFLRRGPGHLAALTMQAIADQVGVHISTVSRASNGKYMETPYGVIELRKLFTGGVEREDGTIESRDNVCQLISEIIEGEDSRRPFSDSLLTRKLQERGLDIARRTVTKYRERAGIAPSRLRKRY